MYYVHIITLGGKMNKLHIQSTQLEELVSSTVQGLRLLEDKLGYEFAETIDTIERLYEIGQRAQELKTKELVGRYLMDEYAEASGRGQAQRIVELNREVA
jgi:hypothetical protein